MTEIPLPKAAIPLIPERIFLAFLLLSSTPETAGGWDKHHYRMK